MQRYQALVPLICVTTYFLVAMAAFTLRTFRHGLPVDREVLGRSASPILGRYLRHYIMWVLAPYERTLVRFKVSPNALTMASLATATASAVSLAYGWFGAGGWLYLLTGILDIVDGRVARATNRVSKGGAFFDSVIDRYAELAVFAGLTFYYRSTWVLGLVLLASAGSMMVSYVRARGEALGVDVKVGTMQRPERLFYLGALVAHSPLYEAIWPTAGDRPMFAPAVFALLMLGISANLTAVRRIQHTLRLLDAQAASPIANDAAITPTLPVTAEPAAAASAAVRPRVAPAASPAPMGRRLLALLRPVG